MSIGERGLVQLVSTSSRVSLCLANRQPPNGFLPTFANLHLTTPPVEQTRWQNVKHGLAAQGYSPPIGCLDVMCMKFSTVSREDQQWAVSYFHILEHWAQ